MKRARILAITVAVLMTGSVSVAAAETAPFGVLDPLIVNDDGTVDVRAWAVDPDDRAGQVTVHVYRDGAFAAATATGTDPRPDIAAAYQAPSGGARAALPDAGTGAHTVCAFALDTSGRAANTLLGCRIYGVPIARGARSTGSSSSPTAPRW